MSVKSIIALDASLCCVERKNSIENVENGDMAWAINDIREIIALDI